MNLPRKTIQVEPAHLPACCPPPEQDGWDQHPRVYLQLSEKTPRRAVSVLRGDVCFAERGGMTQFMQVHPQNPQPRLIRAAAEIVQGGGLIAYPTDSYYALGFCDGRARGGGAGAAFARGGRFAFVCAVLPRP